MELSLEINGMVCEGLNMKILMSGMESLLDCFFIFASKCWLLASSFMVFSSFFHFLSFHALFFIGITKQKYRMTSVIYY